jgi:hypothetical protein
LKDIKEEIRMFGKKILLSCLVATSFLYGQESAVNINNLITMVESLQGDITAMNERLDKISQQSYDARIATIDDREAVEILATKLKTLEGSLKTTKSNGAKDSNVGLSYTPTTENLSKKSQREAYRTIAEKGLVVRMGPGTDTKLVSILPHNSTIYTDCREFENWCYLQEQRGYVAHLFLEKK